MKILSREELKTTLIEKPCFYNAVIINEPGNIAELQDFFPLCKNFVYREFGDVYKEGINAPGLSDVKHILNWVKDKDNIVVACHAGISRSSAIAYLIESTYSDNAIDLIDVNKHLPNVLILKHGCSILQRDVIKSIVELFSKKYDKDNWYIKKLNNYKV